MPMTPAQQDTACALSKHPRFQWRRGMSMLRDAPGKQDNLKLEYVCQSAPNSDRMLQSELFSDSIPDLCDPATVGALEALACELTGCHFLALERAEVVWFVTDESYIYMSKNGEVAEGATRGEAWAALILGLP